ncbi:MAG: AAA family ATPase [Solirubrobacterales bacterium]
MNAVPLEQAEKAARKRPTVEGSDRAWLAMEGPVHASSLAFRPIPERGWAVEGLIPANTVTLFSGDGGAGKSTLALQLACSTVLGHRWLGRDTRGGMAAYVSCEDDIDELHRRLAGICDGEGWDMADLDGLQLFDRVGRENAVMRRGEGFGAGWEDTPWWVRFSNWLRDAGPGLVVLDSLYDFFPGNQLDQGAARTFMGKLRETAHDAGCAIVVLWHPSKSGMESGDGTSGNVAFRNAARAMIYLERDKEATAPNAPRILRGKKSNYGPAADEIALTYENSRFVPVVPEGGPSGFFAGCARRNAETAFLECLESLGKQGRRVNASRNTGNYAPRMMLGMKQAAGFKLQDLEHAMSALFDGGAIVLLEEGPPSHRRSFVTLARTEGQE